MAANAPALDFRILSALAEPNRLAIIELRRDGPRPAGTIGERLALRQSQTPVQRTTEERFDKLDNYLRRLLAEKNRNTGKKG